MTVAMEEPEKRCDACLDRSFSALTVDDVYEIAKAIGTDVEKLLDSCGKENVAGLVTKTVKVLELLESFASRNDAHKLREDELLKTFETIQLQQKKRLGKKAEEGDEKQKIRVRHAEAISSARAIHERNGLCLLLQRYNDEFDSNYSRSSINMPVVILAKHVGRLWSVYRGLISTRKVKRT